MALNTDELNALAQHLASNPSLAELITGEQWMQLVGYYSMVPETFDGGTREVQDSRIALQKFMPFSVDAKFYAITKFRLWYSSLANKIATNTHVYPIVVNSLVTIDNEAIQDYVRHMRDSVIDLKETNKDLPEVVESLFERAAGGRIETKEGIFGLFIALITDDIFPVELARAYYPELLLTPRYESLGLSAPPTEQEVQSAVAIAFS